MRPRHQLLTGFLLSVTAFGAEGQQLPSFTVGDTLRIHAPGVALKRTRVTFRAWGDTVLTLHSTRGDTALAVPFTEVVRLDRYAGKNRLRGALTGAGVLGTVGMLVGYAVGASAVSGCGTLLCEMDAFRYAAWGMLAGVAIGAPVGALAMAPDRWRRVELPATAGFPPYRQPFHETTAFRLLWVAGGLLLAVAVS